MKKSRWRRVAWMIAVFAFFILYVPLFSIIGLSIFTPDPKIPGTYIFTWAGYQTLLQDQSLLDSLILTVVVAAVSTTASTILGTLLAYAVDRFRFPGRKVLTSLALAPLVMPELVLGIALLVWFVLLGITLGRVSIILAHITFTLSFVFVSVRARLQEIDRSYEEAAYDLGANPLQVFFRVLLPLLKPAIVSGALMSFIISFDDFFVTFFTAGVGADTLPLKIYSMTKYGVGQEINALSTLVLGITFLLIFAAFNPFRDEDKTRMLLNH